MISDFKAAHDRKTKVIADAKNAARLIHLLLNTCDAVGICLSQPSTTAYSLDMAHELLIDDARQQKGLRDQVMEQAALYTESKHTVNTDANKIWPQVVSTAALNAVCINDKPLTEDQLSVIAAIKHDQTSILIDNFYAKNAKLISQVSDFLSLKLTAYTTGASVGVFDDLYGPGHQMGAQDIYKAYCTALVKYSHSRAIVAKAKPLTWLPAQKTTTPYDFPQPPKFKK